MLAAYSMQLAPCEVQLAEPKDGATYCIIWTYCGVTGLRFGTDGPHCGHGDFCVERPAGTGAANPCAGSRACARAGPHASAGADAPSAIIEHIVAGTRRLYDR